MGAVRRDGARRRPVAASAAAFPAPALAHGISARSDVPIPILLFVWAAILVLVISFAALAAMWPEPAVRALLAGERSRAGSGARSPAEPSRSSGAWSG